MAEVAGRKAVALLSGGLDSLTAAAVARREGFDLHALSFRYGQRHEVELDCARRLAQALGAVEHLVLDCDLRAFGGSALTGALPVPKELPPAGPCRAIPVTYVPARNTVFLSLALAFAETRGAWDIFLGVNALDFSGYPDCRPEYLRAFEHLANLATRAGVEEGRRFTIHAPLLQMTKAEIIRLGTELGVDYELTSSCYDPAPDGTACGECEACRLRLKGFREAGIADPIRYSRRAR